MRAFVRKTTDRMATFRGSYSVTVTPFTPGGEVVDLEALQRFTEGQIAAGVPGVIVLGTTGEFLAVSDEERTAIVETTVRQVAGRAHVLVGTMNASTPRAVLYSQEAEQLGADGVMVLPPYYYTPTEDEIWGYYRAVSEAISIPIMVYNNPVTSNVDMPASLIGRLTRDFENVRYIKEASMDVARVRDVVEATDGVMNVFAGERQVDSYLLGAVGYVNPYSNYILQSHRLWDLLIADRIEDARRLQRIIDDIDRIIAAGHPTYGHQCYSKALAGAVGYPVGDVRPPLTTFAALGDEGRQRLESILPRIAEFESLVSELGLVQASAVLAAH